MIDLRLFQLIFILSKIIGESKESYFFFHLKRFELKR